MFKIMNKVRSRKGFTLAELMITLVLLGLVLALSAQLFRSIFDKYKLVEQRFLIQSEVQHIVSSFQNDAYNYSLYTATIVDMFREDPDRITADKKLASCPELGKFEENTVTHELTFEKESVKYTYLFCFNGYLYILNSGKNVAVRYFYTDEIPVDIEFTIGTKAFDIDGSGTEGDGTRYEKDADGNFVKDADGNLVPVTNADGSGQKADPVFLDKGVTVSVKGYYTDDEGKTDKSKSYRLNTSFAFSNLIGSINMNSPEGKLTNEYVAGWCITDNKGNPVANSFADVDGYPSASAQAEGVNYEYLSQTGNVIRYISLYNFLDGNLDTSAPSDSTVNFNCATSVLMADSDVGAGVVDSLRDFRDEVLRGSRLGDFLIEKYYEYSPDIIEFAQQSPALKKFLQTAVTDFAYTFEVLK